MTNTSETLWSRIQERLQIVGQGRIVNLWAQLLWPEPWRGGRGRSLAVALCVGAGVLAGSAPIWSLKEVERRTVMVPLSTQSLPRDGRSYFVYARDAGVRTAMAATGDGWALGAFNTNAQPLASPRSVRINGVPMTGAHASLHHIPQIEKFSEESSRVPVHGGRLIFVEPWPTCLSAGIYRHFHHEPFDESAEWEIPPGGPLTAANGASCRFPTWLAAALVGLCLCPSSNFSWIRFCEQPVDPIGFFAVTVVEKSA